MAGYKMTLACSDLADKNCQYVARGDTEEELLVAIKKHGKEAHGFTDKQLKDPKMIKKIMAAIKKK